MENQSLQVRNSLDLQGQVWMPASRDKQSSRDVQKALDDAESDDVRVTLATELCTHVLDALECPHANHVLQKILSVLPPSECQFIIDELVQSGVKAVRRAARSKYGCRIF